MPERSWHPAEQVLPEELLNRLVHMGTVEHDSLVIQQYKHLDTRRHINLDTSGQPWDLAVDLETGAIGARRISLDEAKAHLLN